MEYSFEENPRNIEQLKDELRTLKQGIDTLLFTKLKIDMDKMQTCAGMFDKLKSFASQYGSRTCIITTNYDLLVEEICSLLKILISDGFERQENEQRGTWRNHWTLRDDSVELIKIHGSINWHTTEDDQIVKESNVIHPPYDDGIFIAPTLDTKIYKNILKMLFQKFEDVIKDTHFLIVIGYSFRDERINNVIHNAIDSGKLTLLSISPDSDMHNQRAFGTTIKLDVEDVGVVKKHKNSDLPIYSLTRSFEPEKMDDIYMVMKTIADEIQVSSKVR